MKRLRDKLAIEVLEEQNSARCIPRRYHVFGMSEILERRRRAGMLYVVRHKGVEFVYPEDPSGGTSPDDVSTSADSTSPGINRPPGDARASGDVPSSAPGDASSPPPGVATAPPPGDASSPHLGSTSRKNGGTSSTAPPLVASSIMSEFGYIDDDALKLLISKCRGIASDATNEEIAELGAMTARRIARMRNVANPVGLLINQTAKCFAGEPFQIYRREKAERERTLQELYRDEDGAGKER